MNNNFYASKKKIKSATSLVLKNILIDSYFSRKKIKNASSLILKTINR